MLGFGTQSEELRDLQYRVGILRGVLLLLVAALGFRVWQLQIHEGTHYRDLSENNTTRTVLLEPARGLVYDRHGHLLAHNVSSFSLYVTLEDVRDREVLITKLVELIGLDESLIRKKMSERGAKLVSRKLKEGLTLREAALIESHILDLPGVRIQAESQRNYPVGETSSHLLGYVGEVSAEQLEQEEYQELHLGSIVGQDGIEKTYDRFLRGRAGKKIIEADALGHEKRTLSVDKPVAGDDLYLTIDLRLQQLAESLLGKEFGAIVATDPTSGEILALASRPAFDPNVLSRELTAMQWDAIVQDEGHPLTNRAIQGHYPPGSTFKIIVAAAALETRTVDPTTRVRCGGGFWFGRRLYRDWKAGGHGSMNLSQALVDSCDVFFYSTGEQLGIDRIASYAKQFGLGKPTGIHLPSERSGIVPSPSWKERVKGEPWYPGETISAAIGQGYVTVTPLQMAQVIATIANDGVMYKPRLVRAIRARDTGRVLMLPAVPHQQPKVSSQTLKLIQKALAEVVTDGTAKRARSEVVTIAGKTGTAQTASLRENAEEENVPKKLRDHAWFVAYAPAEQPRIAVAVLVENVGHGGSAAAPLAKRLIEAYMKLEPVEPEHGLPSIKTTVAKAGLITGVAHD